MLNPTSKTTLEELVNSRYNAHDHSTATFRSSTSPWTYFDKFSIYTLGVRKYKLFNQSPKFGGMVKGGGMISESFDSFDEAIEWCYKTAEEQLAELDAKIEEDRKKYS